MKRFLLALLLAAAPAFGQVTDETGATGAYTPDRGASATLGALNNVVKVRAEGRAGIGFQLTTTNLSATVKPQYSIDDSVWFDGSFVTGGTVSTTTVFTGSTVNSYKEIVVPAGAKFVRVIVSAYTSGTSTGVLRATETQASFTYTPAASGSSSATIVDGAGAGQADVVGSAPTTEQGLVVRNIPSGTQNTAVTSALPAGNNNIGDVDVATIAAGNNNIGDVDVASLPALPAGSNNIGDVDLASAIPAGNNNIGDVDVATIAAGNNNIGNVDVVTLPNVIIDSSTPVDVNCVTGCSGSGGAVQGAVTTSAPTYTNGTDNDLSLTTTGRLRTEATVSGAIPAGTNNIGDVDVLTLPALPTGSNTIGAVTGSGSFTVAQGTAANLNATVTDGSGALTVDGTVAVTQGTAANLKAEVVGTGTFATQADTELPAAAALADTTSNPTVPGVGAFNMVWNGSTWDRMSKTGWAAVVTNAGTFAVQAAQSGSWTSTVTQGTAANLNATVEPGTGIFNVRPASPAANSYLPVRLTDGSSFYNASGGGGGSALAPVTATQTIDPSGADSLELDLDGRRGVSMQIVASGGPYGDDPAVEFTVDGTNWTPAACWTDTNIAASGCAAGFVVLGNGSSLVELYPPQGATKVRVKTVAGVTGTVDVTLTASQTASFPLDSVGGLRLSSNPGNPLAVGFAATQFVKGELTNNVTTDAAFTANFGTLPAVATAADPSYTEGKKVALSTDLAGNLRIIGTGGGGSGTVEGDKENDDAVPGTNNLGVLPAIATTSAPTYTDTNQVALTTTLAGRLRVDGTGGSFPVTDSGGSLTVDGTVTANAGTGNFTVVQGTAASLNATVTDGSGALTVDGTVAVTQGTAANLNATVVGTGTLAVQNTAATPAGNNNIGDVDVATIAAGNNNIGDVDVASIAAGNNNIGDVDVASVAGNVTVVQGTAANLKVEASAGTNLNTSALALEAGGNLAASATSLAAIDDLPQSQGASTSGVKGVLGLTATTTSNPTYTTAQMNPPSTNTRGETRVAEGGVCDPLLTSTAAVAISSSGNNQIVALNGSDLIYVCSITVIADAAVGLQLIYGHGSACATGETDISGVMSLAATGGFVTVDPLRVPAGEAFCMELSGAIAVNGWIRYRQGVF